MKPKHANQPTILSALILGMTVWAVTTGCSETRPRNDNSNNSNNFNTNHNTNTNTNNFNTNTNANQNNYNTNTNYNTNHNTNTNTNTNQGPTCQEVAVQQGWAGAVCVSSPSACDHAYREASDCEVCCQTMSDPCEDVVCDQPPSAHCQDVLTLRTYTLPGTCSGGTCNYVVNDTNCSYGCVNASCRTTQPGFHLRVLHVAFNPASGGRNLAEEYFSHSGMTAQEIENFIATETIKAFLRLSDFSILYEVVHTLRIDDFPVYPGGFSYDVDSYETCINGDPGGLCEDRKSDFPYVDWLQDHQLCALAAMYDADEIWITSCPFIMNYENFMIGPGIGFDINGAAFTLPACERHYAVMGSTYERLDTILHVYGHRIERTMNHLSQFWQNSDYENYWEDFAKVTRYAEPMGQTHPVPGVYCGNAHFAHNSLMHYDYNNMTAMANSCLDWDNFPNFTGATEHIDCTAWGCNDAGWQEYWFAALPRHSGEITRQSTMGDTFFIYRNWWKYLLYPDAVIAQYEQSYTGWICGSGLDCASGYKPGSVPCVQSAGGPTIYCCPSDLQLDGGRCR
jgi:hypothetical protein